jgi:hypothetical protein
MKKTLKGTITLREFLEKVGNGLFEVLKIPWTL